MHSHGDLELLKPSPPDARIRQGITTELLGQDGVGKAPVKESDIDVLSQLLGGSMGCSRKNDGLGDLSGAIWKHFKKVAFRDNVAVLFPMDLFA